MYAFHYVLIGFSYVFQLQQKESDLQYLTALRERREEESKKEWTVSSNSNTYSFKDVSTLQQILLREEGFDNDAALDSTIKKLETDVKKSRKKDTDGDEMQVRDHTPAL